MSSLSIEFLLLAAGVTIVYYLLPLSVRWVALLGGSALFALLSGRQSAAHLSAVALLMWGGALLLQKKRRRWLLALLLGLELGAMAFLKYYPALSGARLLLPVGLSYFTFQSAGYLIDVYRGKAQAQKNPLKAWLFIGYFPQLSQGPISSWRELSGPLFSGRPFEPEGFVSGFALLLWGYFKKLVVADRLAPLTKALLEGEALPGWLILLGAALYAVRLYMDFSGGMDVARGVSFLLGVELPENFRRPFFARSLADYWRRWHITLGAWFRSYLLYPMVTSRGGVALGRAAGRALGKKTGRAIPGALATLLVFLLIGVWHGASWNAVIYGAYFGLLMGASMLLEPLWKRARKRCGKGRTGFFSLARTWLLLLPPQYFAFTPLPAQGMALLKGTFQHWSFADFGARLTAIMPPLEWAIAGAGCLIVLAVDGLCERGRNVRGGLAKAPAYVRWPLLLALLGTVAVLGIYGAGYDETAFLYTQF